MRKIYEKYQLDGGITAKISPSEISLKTYHGKNEFVFRHSKPEIVEFVSARMLESVAIAKKQKKSEFGPTE